MFDMLLCNMKLVSRPNSCNSTYHIQIAQHVGAPRNLLGEMWNEVTGCQWWGVWRAVGEQWQHLRHSICSLNSRDQPLCCCRRDPNTHQSCEQSSRAKCAVEVQISVNCRESVSGVADGWTKSMVGLGGPQITSTTSLFSSLSSWLPSSHAFVSSTRI